ncbi:MAG: type II secretion system protein [Gemmataceae bacterium]
MKTSQWNRRRFGYTLTELVVVLAVIAILAALIIPKFSGITDQAQQSSAASNISEVSRMIQTFEAQFNKSPSGLSTLRTGSDGSGGLLPSLHPNLTAILEEGTLDADGVTSLINAGIRSFHPNNRTGVLPSDTDGGGHINLLTASPPINITRLQKPDVGNFSPTTWQPVTVLLDRGMGVNPFKAVRYASPHIVLGIGNHNELKGNIMQDAPLFQTVQPTDFYARAMAVYEIPPGGAKARFVGVIGPDGGYHSQYMENYTNMQKTN